MEPAVNQSWHSNPPSGTGCPFYGFAWPADSRRLIHEGGNRCGLALDRFDACAMEQAGCNVNMHACPMVHQFADFIRSAAPVIAFVTPDHPEGLPYSVWWHRTVDRPDREPAPQV